jgi:GT2 family glycosyltransferase
MPRIVVIVSSFNRVALLREALASLRPLLCQNELTFRIVVYDAGSTDGSLAVLENFRAEHAPGCVDILVPKAGEDTSFAAGLNRACGFAARRRDVDYFFLFETDNLISGLQPVKRAVSLLETDSTIAAVGFTVRTKDGRPAGFGERFPRLLSFILGQQLSARLKLEEMRVLWVEGGGTLGRYGYSDVIYTSPLLVRTAAWERVGGMDAKVFPFSDSDVDLAFRFRDHGYRCAVIDDPGVVHDNRGQVSEWSATRTLHWHGARFRLLRRHSGLGIVAAIPLLFVRHLTEWCILCARPSAGWKAKLKTRAQLLRSVWWGYRLHR